jgi:hypothetical protein
MLAGAVALAAAVLLLAATARPASVLLHNLAEALVPTLLTLLLIDRGGAQDWSLLGLVFPGCGMAVPVLIRRALARRPVQATAGGRRLRHSAARRFSQCFTTESNDARYLWRLGRGHSRTVDPSRRAAARAAGRGRCARRLVRHEDRGSRGR